MYIYSNDLTQIRNGLTNYIGSLLNSTSFKGKAGKQVVFSILIEEALKLSQDEDKKMDLYINKPLLRATKILFEQRIDELTKIKQSNPLIEEQIENYKILIISLDKLINSII